MTEALLEFGPRRRVLEIGTGSGYQAAVLSPLVESVYTVERIDELQQQARRRLRKLGCRNVFFHYEDGTLGWPERAPFDAIIITAATSALEPVLLRQLAPDGVLIAPVGGPEVQQLMRWQGVNGNWSPEVLGGVSFVPLLKGTV
jgi:protein-L-isoaspartate(D-aspartate) O-methyltransferase